MADILTLAIAARWLFHVFSGPDKFLLFLIATNIAVLSIALFAINRAERRRLLADHEHLQWEVLNKSAMSLAETAKRALDTAAKTPPETERLREQYVNACSLVALVGRANPPLPNELLRALCDDFLTKEHLNPRIEVQYHKIGGDTGVIH